MEIALAPERSYHMMPQVSFDQARSRVEEKKVSLVAGMIGSLFTRPDPAEIQLSSSGTWRPGCVPSTTGSGPFRCPWVGLR
jgi:hypothetical protein